MLYGKDRLVVSEKYINWNVMNKFALLESVPTNEVLFPCMPGAGMDMVATANAPRFIDVLRHACVLYIITSYVFLITTYSRRCPRENNALNC